MHRQMRYEIDEKHEDKVDEKYRKQSMKRRKMKSMKNVERFNR